MATRVIDDIKLQNIAVAIQGKDGGGQMTVDEMPTRIATIPTQDNTTLNSLIDRSITSIENDEVTSIGTNAFRTCTNLTSVSFPNATSIGTNTFYNCTNLTSASLPNVTSINANTFYNCTNLSIVILGKRATLSNSNAFSDANNAIIYVQPEDLEWYSTATNWSTLYAQNRIKSIEDLTGDDLAWYQEQLARYQAA